VSNPSREVARINLNVDVGQRPLREMYFLVASFRCSGEYIPGAKTEELLHVFRKKNKHTKKKKKCVGG